VKDFSEFLTEASNTHAADINEILYGYFLLGGTWRGFQNAAEARKQVEDKKIKIGEEQYTIQQERARVMANETLNWARDNGYNGSVSKVWWTARPGVLSKAVGYAVDSRKNPTDILVQFTDKQFLGLSAKSTKSKGDIGFKNPGAGTIDKLVGTDLSSHYFKTQVEFAKKHGLSLSTAARKKEIRAGDDAIKAAANQERNNMLSELRDILMSRLKSYKQDELRKLILSATMDAEPVMPRYIKVTGHGNGPCTASISDPLKNDKATAVATQDITLEPVGNDSIGVSAGGMRIEKIRFKQESQAMASSLKLSCDPW